MLGATAFDSVMRDGVPCDRITQGAVAARMQSTCMAVRPWPSTSRVVREVLPRYVAAIKEWQWPPALETSVYTFECGDRRRIGSNVRDGDEVDVTRMRTKVVQRSGAGQVETCM